MDHAAIICVMTDGLTRGPDQDVHVPSVDSTKVPFSACRCHILGFDYRWGSMGSDETATATTGGPRVIPYFTGTGRHRAQIVYFFRGQIGPWRSLDVGLVVGSRLHRIRRRCGSLVLSESPGSKPWPIIAKAVWSAERNRPKMLEAAALAG